MYQPGTKIYKISQTQSSNSPQPLKYTFLYKHNAYKHNQARKGQIPKHIKHNAQAELENSFF